MLFGRSASAVLTLWAWAAAPGWTQTQTNFDNASGWTLAGGSNGVKWAVDGTPAGVTGGAYQSASTSLNYNNATNYNSGGTNSGTATSAAIPVPATSPTLTFWCNFQTEPGSENGNAGYDTRTLTLTPGTGTSLSAKFGVTNYGAILGACSAMGTWHQHTVALQPSWVTVVLQFKFDTVDSYGNSYPGWFLDTLQVSGGGSGNTGTKLTTVQEWTFNSGLQNWTPIGSNATVTWASDATPATAPGGAFKSSPNSLNYNNGTNYNSGAANNGTATSPEVDLASLATPQLVFWCNYQTETSTSFDKRYFEISNDGFQTTVLSVQLKGTGTTGGLGDCSASGTWHTHAATLDVAWGKVKFRFRFDTVDAYGNAYAGWFLDDVQLQASGTVAGALEDPHVGEDSGGSPKRHWCGSSVASADFSILDLSLAGFVIAAALLLTFLRRPR